MGRVGTPPRSQIRCDRLVMLLGSDLLISAPPVLSVSAPGGMATVWLRAVLAGFCTVPLQSLLQPLSSLRQSPQPSLCPSRKLPSMATSSLNPTPSFPSGLFCFSHKASVLCLKPRLPAAPRGWGLPCVPVRAWLLARCRSLSSLPRGPPATTHTPASSSLSLLAVLTAKA